MTDDSKKKHESNRKRGTQFESSAVKRELERLAEAAPGANVSGTSLDASQVTPENVVRAVMGGPERPPKPKGDKHGSVHDWPIATLSK